MIKGKKIPVRMCVACRKPFAKKDLIRIVTNKAGELFVDDTGKAAGRGAYVCKDPRCIERCLRKKSLSKAFKREISAEVRDALKSLAESASDDAAKEEKRPGVSGGDEA